MFVPAAWLESLSRRAYSARRFRLGQHFNLPYSSVSGNLVSQSIGEVLPPRDGPSSRRRREHIRTRSDGDHFAIVCADSQGTLKTVIPRIRFGKSPV